MAIFASRDSARALLALVGYKKSYHLAYFLLLGSIQRIMKEKKLDTIFFATAFTFNNGNPVAGRAIIHYEKLR